MSFLSEVIVVSPPTSEDRFKHAKVAVETDESPSWPVGLYRSLLGSTICYPQTTLGCTKPVVFLRVLSY